ncbi:MAG TPA: hypothetical protein VFA10_00410 [Ktedonobacteraceae bacterium]|nr:hypothetical protein [Ktedonobacteraceae bacterium]
MKFWMTTGYYGGDILLIEQAAKDCGAQLIAVKGYDLKDYPGNREYVKGEAEYLFLLEREVKSGKEAALREARKTIHVDIRNRVRELALQKYG